MKWIQIDPLESGEAGSLSQKHIQTTLIISMQIGIINIAAVFFFSVCAHFPHIGLSFHITIYPIVLCAPNGLSVGFYDILAWTERYTQIYQIICFSFLGLHFEQGQGLNGST